MKHLLRALLCSLALLTLGTGAQAATDAATAEALLRKSGTWAQLAEVAPQLRAGITEGIAQGAPELPAAEKARLGKAAEAAYTADRLRAITVSVLSQSLDAAHVPALRSWFDSRVGQTVARLEEDTSLSDQEMDEIVAKGQQVLTEMSAERRRLTEELVAVSRAAEFLADVAIGMDLALALGVRSVMPDGGKQPPATTRSDLESQRSQLQQALSPLALASAALVYDPLPTDELGRYVEFLKSTPGRHFTDVGMRAMVRALLLASEDFGRQMASPGTAS